MRWPTAAERSPRVTARSGENELSGSAGGWSRPSSLPLSWSPNWPTPRRGAAGPPIPQRSVRDTRAASAPRGEDASPRRNRRAANLFRVAERALGPRHPTRWGPRPTNTFWRVILLDPRRGAAAVLRLRFCASAGAAAGGGSRSAARSNPVEGCRRRRARDRRGDRPAGQLRRSEPGRSGAEVRFLSSTAPLTAAKEKFFVYRTDRFEPSTSGH